MKLAITKEFYLSLPKSIRDNLSIGDYLRVKWNLPEADDWFDEKAKRRILRAGIKANPLSSRFCLN